MIASFVLLQRHGFNLFTGMKSEAKKGHYGEFIEERNPSNSVHGATNTTITGKV